MKISNKLFDEIIVNLAGEEVLELAKLLRDKKSLSEFKIAEILNLELNEVRNLLYKLYHINLVSFTKRKDLKKGWYVYYWIFKPKQLRFAYNKLNKQKLNKLKEIVNKEMNHTFFLCANGCLRLDFERALNYEYRCPECGSLMHHQDNSSIISKLNEQIKQLEDSIF